MLVTTQSVKAKVLVSSLSVLIIVFLEINYKFGLKKKKQTSIHGVYYLPRVNIKLLKKNK